MTKNILLIFFTNFVFNSWCFSQNESLKLTSPLNVSPEAASFSKFGDIPVSLNSGIPNISIPIYTIKYGDVNFPIQLSYNASGVKVEEMASMVGLGWNLSYTGSITRQVRGLPDESNYGYHTTGEQVEAYINDELSGEDLEDFISNYRQGNIDGEKDIYYFNLPGSVSGKFFLDDNNVYTTIPKSNIKIENIDAFNANTGFWRITTDQGVEYIFNKPESTTTQSFFIVDGSSTTTTTEGVSAWYIGQIIDATGNKIDFNYGGYQNSFRAKATESQRIVMSANYSAQDSRSVVDNYNQISGPRIESIQWKQGKIKFAYADTIRLDIGGNDTALSEIRILDYNNTLIKKYAFSTSYFEKAPTEYTTDATLTYRLKLDSLTEISSTGIKNPPYKFTYNSLLMDHRRSNSQDRWGYYNGKTNTDFVTYFRLINNTNYVKYGANKDIDTNYTQANLIEKIYYPTGGNSSFEFEANRYKVFKPDTFHIYSSGSFASTTGDNSGGDFYQYLHTFTDSFTVAPADTTYRGKAAIKAKITKYIEDPYVFHNITVAIIGSNGVRYINDGDTVLLAAGNYVLYSIIETEFAHTPFASIDASLYIGTMHPPGNYDELVGGVRVKKIINSNGTNITGIKKFKYNKFGENYSSGSVGFSSPEFDTYEEVVNPCTPCQSVNYFVYSSSHHYPLMQTSQGGYVSYANVEVQDQDEDGNNNGKTEYSYTTFNDFSDFVDPNFPFAHSTTYEWTRGLLLKEKYYSRNANNSYGLIKEKRNGYAFLNDLNDTTRREIAGITGGAFGVFTVGTSAEALNNWYAIAKCYTVSELYYPKSDTTIEYDLQGNSISTINQYDYSKYPFLRKWQKTTNSKGDTLKTNFRYPYDYSSGGFITPMKQKNMFAVPVEQFTEKITPGNDTSVISGVITSYKTNSLLKDKVFKLNTSSPIPKNNFTVSFMNGTNFYPSSYYEPLLLYNKYDTSRNIIEQQRKDDILMSYIWDYSFNYPIAEVKNADSASIAYTSFEANGKGGWTFSGTPVSDTTSITGKKAYNLSNGDISKSSLNNSTTYTVSYWSKNGAQNVYGTTPISGKSINGWTYYEHNLTPTYYTITISGSGTIDELRLYPKNALMTTYTYLPLIGVRDQCDVNNRIIHYEYDGFNRLKLIRDEDGNILKKIEYQYQATYQQ